MDRRNDLENVERLRLAVMRLARRLRQQAERGVTPSMLSAMASLEQGPLTLRELAEAERVTAPTMTRIVARLEEDGLVERHADPVDRRVARMQLSDVGQRLVRSNRQRKDAYLTRRLAHLGAGAEQVDECVTLLERLLEDAE